MDNVKNDAYYVQSILTDLRVIYLTLSEDIPALIKELDKME